MNSLRSRPFYGYRTYENLWDPITQVPSVSKINPHPPKLGPLKVNPERISANLCDPKQTGYPLTETSPSYGIYVNYCLPPHAP